MSIPDVKPVEAAAASSLIDVLLLAFSTDPLARYAMPSASQYLPGMRIVFAGLGAPAFEHGTAHGVEGFGGGAIWLPPGVAAPNEAIEGAIEFMEPARIETFVKTLEAMESYHPTEPHWYLNFIGVDSARQGEGLGAALMKYALQQVDEAGCIAYLESSNPRNMSLYGRFGFETIGRIQFDDGPEVHPMLRVAR